MDSQKDCSESSTSNQCWVSPSGSSLGTHGSSAYEISIGDNDNDNDIMVSPGHSRYSVDDSRSYLTKCGLLFYSETWQSF